MIKNGKHENSGSLNLQSVKKKHTIIHEHGGRGKETCIKVNENSVTHGVSADQWMAIQGTKERK